MFTPLIVYMYALYYLPLATLLLSFLQVYLCHRNLRWGRVLPIVSAGSSVLASLIMALFAVRAAELHWWAVSLQVLSALAVFNLPTLVFFLIYCYQKRRRDREDLERMKISDLG